MPCWGPYEEGDIARWVTPASQDHRSPHQHPLCPGLGLSGALGAPLGWVQPGRGALRLRPAGRALRQSACINRRAVTEPGTCCQRGLSPQVVGADEAVQGLGVTALLPEVLLALPEAVWCHPARVTASAGRSGGCGC